ncbi:MAG: hypothetical protein U9R38_07220 [Candidatus Margulisiibacteriota bacterium]|nr:hypothetical protein [Candidatus Margulisiibacteriota bacterium]
MIKKPELLRMFDKEKLSFKEAMRIFESLWQEALSLKVLPSKNPLEGIEKDLRIAKILNSCSKN